MSLHYGILFIAFFEIFENFNINKLISYPSLRSELFRDTNTGIHGVQMNKFDMIH